MGKWGVFESLSAAARSSNIELRITNNSMKLSNLFIFITIVSCHQTQDFNNEIKLDLRGRHLTAIPDSVFELTNLTYMDLGSSNPVFFPPLSALVDTNANNITALSNEIGNLTNLKTLILNSNKLVSLPVEISKLTKLEHLDLSLNKNFKIVKELDKIKKLQGLKTLEIAGIEPMDSSIVETIKNELPGIKIIVSSKEYIENIQNQNK